MLNKYYYLVSSLPLLLFDEKPGILKKEFLEECGKWVSLPEFTILQRADINSAMMLFDNQRILRQWKKLDSCLRGDLSKARKIRQKTPEEKLPDSMVSVFKQETPLLMERELAKKEWSILDELTLGCYFDINILIIYFLKLQILERFEMFNKDEGMRVFKEACEVIYD